MYDLCYTCWCRIWKHEDFILRRPKPPRVGCCWRCCPLLPAAAPDPTESEKITPLSCSHLVLWKGSVSAQVSFLFLGSYCLKNNNILFPLKGNLDTVQPRTDIINNNLFRGNKSHHLISFFPLKYFVLVENIQWCKTIKSQFKILLGLLKIWKIMILINGKEKHSNKRHTICF